MRRTAQASAIPVPSGWITAAPPERQPHQPAKKRRKVRPGKDSELPFEALQSDHAETPLRAYQDIAPVLEFIAERLGRTKAELRIWDPFYCEGSVVAHLGEIGYSGVHNEPVDCWAEIGAGRIPEHDVLLTNPAYSGDHIPKLLKFALESGKPWLLLVPYWVYKKSYFSKLDPGAVFLCPKRRYFYRNGRIGRESETGVQKVTSPWESFWFVWVPGGQAEMVEGWEQLYGPTGVAERTELRLAHSFLKRRGDPGYHTALDAAGSLIGRPDKRGIAGGTQSTKQESDPLPSPIPNFKRADGKKKRHQFTRKKSAKGRKMCGFRQGRLYDKEQ
eukprot:TRINITY_DN50507_c0_g1_i2.p1 TRINITY_DN50507_c0_g1~~TRINITY_DN50507_c0_g1_i2.p1  ORF type:complete len:331 (-),score=55.66 TRINITY_DN50507_c0_g1_i2:153-1145(-)